jgi:glycerol-3-phosphate dehydrogenase (NAD(P)+)
MVTLHLDDDVIRSLSDNELNILKYVYTHAEDIVHISIHEMAKQVSYSTATILRFCKKLGYSGFSEFKYALAAAIRRSPAPPAPAKPANLDTQMILEQICSHIESTSHLILDKQLEQVFHIFDDNCRIYLYSPGGITATLIDYFEKMLFSIGRQNVYKIESVRMGEHILRNFPEASAWILISTTGSFPHTARLARLARMNNVPVISITKGMLDLEDGTMLTYPEYWRKKLPEESRLGIYAIGGPCTARDLADHDPSFVGYCGPDMETLKWIRSLFATEYYIISLTTDVAGLECAVALKNGYALGTALAIGMAEKAGDDGVNHNNSEAALFQESVREMLLLLGLVGGGTENIMYAAGDLNVTVAAGRSRTVGLLLGKGLPIEEIEKQLKGQTLEAVVIATRTARAVKALARAGKARESDFPLLMHVNALLNEGAALDIPWKEFQKEM